MGNIVISGSLTPLEIVNICKIPFIINGCVIKLKKLTHESLEYILFMEKYGK